MIFLLLLLLPAVGLADCDIPTVLQQIRPGAQWTLHGTDYSGLEWLDAVQAKPTALEVQAGISGCPAQTNLKQRSDAIADLLTAQDDRAKLTRSILQVLFDENNLQREWNMSLKAAVAASTSLADLKVRFAALPDTPDRTVSQARTAVQNKINSGDSD